MTRLACQSCGRQIYATAPLESLFAEERRCPRCGAILHTERRETDRRSATRRQNPADEPGAPTEVERRAAEQRTSRRRRPADGTARVARSESGGWTD